MQYIARRETLTVGPRARGLILPPSLARFENYRSSARTLSLPLCRWVECTLPLFACIPRVQNDTNTYSHTLPQRHLHQEDSNSNKAQLEFAD